MNGRMVRRPSIVRLLDLPGTQASSAAAAEPRWYPSE
jgi:hypothetical protein